MKVQDLFTQLSFVELATLSMGMKGAGAIADDQQARIITAANDALSEIYARFAHKTSYVKIQLSAARKLYTISGTPTPDYILETVEEPFNDDVLSIMSVHVLDDPATVENEAESLNRTDSMSGMTFETLSYNEILVRDPVEGAQLLIEYQAGHPVLSIPVDLNQDILLVPHLRQALRLHIASSVFRTMGGDQGLTKSGALLAQYEQIMQMADLNGVVGESHKMQGHRPVLDQGWL